MPDSDNGSPPPRRAQWYAYTDASSLGIEIAISVCGGTIGGWYLERHLTHWSPWTMLLGLGLGLWVATLAVIRTARNYQASLRSEPPPTPLSDSPPLRVNPDE